MARPTRSPTNPVALSVGLPSAPILTTRAAGGTGMAFLEVNVPHSNSGVTATVPDDAFVVLLQMRRQNDFDLYADGKLIRPEGFGVGEIGIFDLRANVASDTRDPYHAVDFYLPRRALSVLENDGDLPAKIQDLRQPFGSSVRDPVAQNLLLAMRPALSLPPEQTPALFVDHVALALTIHIANTYGDGGREPRQWNGGLAPWQERTAKELIDCNLGSGIALADLARACDLSTRHFTRAFRQSTGMAPHQWLQHRRVEQAKDLLENSAAPLSIIALQCGFVDQSHFTRIFSRAAGKTPGNWRRLRRE